MSPMNFSVLNADEWNLYKICQNKETFTGTTESIVIYDVDVETFYNLLIINNQSPTHDLVMKKLRKYCNDIPAAYVYISFMLLHELGHYKQYLYRGKNVYSYMNWCLEERTNAMKHQILMNKAQNCIDHFVLPLSTPNKSERIELESIVKEYRNIPKEKEADSFLYSHMEQAMATLSKRFQLD